jgi:hypothetical protein
MHSSQFFVLAVQTEAAMMLTARPKLSPHPGWNWVDANPFRWLGELILMT